jgi:uncharacterized protein (TIGR03118 family)
LGIVAFAVLAAAPAYATLFDVANLITDDQTANPARTTDPDLVNAWGISYAPTGPFWVSDNGTHVTTLYSVNPANNATAKLGLTVSIPGDGSITGQTFNPSFGGGAFNGDLFTFVSEDGTISGWRFSLGSAAEVLQSGSDLNVYKGTTFATVGGHAYMYSANFRAGTIDVLKGDGAAPTLPGSFTDPGIPAGYAPFNVQNIGGNIFVTYALQDSEKHDEIAGPGNGFVDEYDTSGNFIGRVGSNGTLNAPWGLVLAAASFGDVAGDLLVGNFGDGTINIFKLGSDTFLGQLTDKNGDIISIDGLWGLIAGNGTMAGSAGDIYFSAGPNGEGHGLFGVIARAPEPWTMPLLLAGFCIILFMRSRRIVA